MFNPGEVIKLLFTRDTGSVKGKFMRYDSVFIEIDLDISGTAYGSMARVYPVAGISEISRG